MSVFGRAPRDDPASLARVGFVAQETPLYRDLSVADHLEMGRRLNGQAWDRPSAAERLGKLSISLERRAGELSGGEQQMLALTAVLAMRPRLLLIDEMSMGLAPLVVRSLLPVIRTAAESEGVGV
ncbi:MAG: ATP-binding cassette domain-containing protein, partial [Actinomycetota bacterium]